MIDKISFIILAANEQVFAMAGHSLLVLPGTEADLFVLPKIRFVADRIPSRREQKPNRVTNVEVAFRRPCYCKYFCCLQSVS
jgi:hypothetical protein